MINIESRLLIFFSLTIFIIYSITTLYQYKLLETRAYHLIVLFHTRFPTLTDVYENILIQVKRVFVQNLLFSSHLGFFSNNQS